MQIVIEIDEELYQSLRYQKQYNPRFLSGYEKTILDGTPLPKGHGKIVDIGRIDEDRMEQDNPIIYLTTNSEYIEAVSLDYLNNLPAVIEADNDESEDKENDKRIVIGNVEADKGE